MKKMIIIIMAVVITFALSSKAEAVDAEDIENSQMETLDTDSIEDALSSEAEEILGGAGVEDAYDANGILSTMWGNISSSIQDILLGGVKSSAIILVIAMLCRAGASIYGGFSSSSVPRYISIAGVLAIAAVAVSDVNSFIGLGIKTLDQLDTFSKALLPTLSAAAAASGAITSAAAKYAVTALFVDVLITISSNVIMPIIYAYIATSIAGAALGGDGLKGATALFKWVAVSLLTIVVLVFVGYLTISGVVTGATDAVTTRVAKTAISAVPVVGSIVSDAASSVLAGISTVRNVIGVFGVLAVLAICAVPFLHLAVHYLSYKLVSGLVLTVSDGPISKLVSDIGTAFGIVMGVTGSAAIMLFFSIISIIKVVSGG